MRATRSKYYENLGQITDACLCLGNMSAFSDLTPALCAENEMFHIEYDELNRPIGVALWCEANEKSLSYYVHYNKKPIFSYEFKEGRKLLILHLDVKFQKPSLAKGIINKICNNSTEEIYAKSRRGIFYKIKLPERT